MCGANIVRGTTTLNTLPISEDREVGRFLATLHKPNISNDLPSLLPAAQPYLMLARYYSSSLGRFLPSEPIFTAGPHLPQVWNGYAYVHSNPILLIDPRGLCAGVSPVGERTYSNYVRVTPEVSDADWRAALSQRWQAQRNFRQNLVPHTRAGMGGDLLEFIDLAKTTHEVFSILREPPGRQREFDAARAAVSIGAGTLASSLVGGEIGAEFGISEGPAGVIVGFIVGEEVGLAYDALNTTYPITSPIGYGSGPTSVYVASPLPGGYSGIPFPRH